MVLSSRSGQAVMEYLLLLGVVVSMAVIVMAFFREFRIQERITKPFTAEYAAVYQYGHPQAKGPDSDEGASKHPRVDNNQNDNFRIFMNPDVK